VARQAGGSEKDGPHVAERRVEEPRGVDVQAMLRETAALLMSRETTRSDELKAIMARHGACERAA
jgi:hypothetical protein